jgi:hypothetical protein
MRASLFAVAILVTACAAPPHLTGPCAEQLSDSDVREITRVARAFEQKSHLVRITARRPDSVQVEFVKYEESGSIHTTFTVARRSGKWVRDQKAPIQVRGHFVEVVS